MPDTVQVCGILFSDVVRSSASKNDIIISEIQGHLQDFVKKHISSDKCIYYNTWGDGLMIVCNDPNDCLEYALEFRDWYKNRNWMRLGIPEPIKVRTGLHAERLIIKKDGNKITSVSGKHVVLTARIEPIVPAGEIYCTETFYLHVKEDSSGFIGFNDIGSMKLAKSFGEMRLYQIMDKGESFSKTDRADSILFGVTIPKIRKEFKDSDKNDFLESGFEYICEYFLKASQRLQESDKDLKVETKMASPTKLTSEVFVKRNKGASCQIWLSKEDYSRGIHFSEKIQVIDNSYNESLHVYSDGYTLSFQSMGMINFSPKKNLNYQQATELLWKVFMRQLQ